MCQQLGWLVNLEKSGYLFDLRSGWVRLTPDRWQNLQEKKFETAIPTGLPGLGIHVLDRFTNSYRKASSSGRLHMRPLQWHFKTTGGYQNH